MISLEKFTAADFEVFKSWITNIEELFQFAGPVFTYPVTDEQLNNYLHLKDIQPFKIILTETNKTIGHCEFNYQQETPRLSRILVGDKNMRSKGLGKEIVLKMAEKLFENPNTTKLDLNVFDWNKAAIKCYENAGFVINNIKTPDLKVGNEIWKRVNMALEKSKFIFHTQL